MDSLTTYVSSRFLVHCVVSFHSDLGTGLLGARLVACRHPSRTQLNIRLLGGLCDFSCCESYFLVALHRYVGPGSVSIVRRLTPDGAARVRVRLRGLIGRHSSWNLLWMISGTRELVGVWLIPIWMLSGFRRDGEMG